MNENYKILVAYDGSDFANAALTDLRFAGLTESDVEVLIMSVAEVWLPPADSGQEEEEEKEERETPPQFVAEIVRKKHAKNLQILEDTKNLTEKAAEKLHALFPNWNVRSEATYGSPAWEILSRADEFKPDLIAVGSQGLSAFQRIWLGSVSQKIVTEAKCSVRVSRRTNESENVPVRLVLAFDGTDGAEKAAEAISRRRWQPESEVRVIIVEDYENIRSSFIGDNLSLEERGEEIVKQLQKANLNASLKIVEGDPKNLIVREAELFQADCIFVGATKFGGAMERFLLGSVSSAITTRAHCSVEVIRENAYKS
jgi:nucleotide-binding universal stress UspA family protein